MTEEDISLDFIQDDTKIRRLGGFELPKNLVESEETSGATHGKFTAEPFEMGYGHTIGNGLRRILLNSIEGAAFSSVKIEGVEHEFQSIDGVVEDVVDIILNIKNILLISHSRDPVHLVLDVEKEGVVTAGDIEPEANIEIINPDQIICTIDKKFRFRAEFKVCVGRGYATAEENAHKGMAIGAMPIDSLFSPVRRVNYHVDQTRVGKMTNYDKLILEIFTDGRITPGDALHEAVAIFGHHLDVFNKAGLVEQIEFETAGVQVNEDQNRLRKLLNMSVNEIELSVRAANCLNNANITTVGELVVKPEADMLKFRNFGKKSLREIKERLGELGLTLGMAIEPALLDSFDQVNAP